MNAVKFLLLAILVAVVSGDTYDARLIGNGNMGKLELHWQGTWVNVCPDVFDTNAASAACRGMGYSYLCKQKEIDVHNVTEEAQELFLTAQPQCRGTEETLSDCSWQNITLPDSCYTRQRHTVLTCANSSEVEIHLAGGHLPSEGIPEVRCHPDDDWSTICNDLQWDVRDCRVICKQMGYKTCTSWRGDTNYDLDGKDILFSSVTCGLDERNILECSGERDPTDCDFDGDGVAWMSCGHEVNILGEDVLLCGSQHSCKDRCGDWQRDAGCHCDAACRDLNDCCVDYEEICESIEQSEWPVQVQFPDSYTAGKYACTTVGSGHSRREIFTIDKCPSAGVGQATRDACEGAYNVTDVFATTPVVDSAHRTYRNIFCAICHGLDVEAVTAWDIVLQYVTNHNDLQHDAVFDVTVPEGDFYTFQPHPSQRYRWCATNILTECTPELKNTSHSRRCNSYYAPISISHFYDLPTYKNPDCRNCEGYLNYLSPPFEANYCMEKVWRCFGLGEIPCRAVSPFVLMPDAFASLEFKYSKLDDYGRRAGKTCLGQGVIYDPFLDICRILQCPTYYQNVAGVCVPSEIPLFEKLEVKLGSFSPSTGRVEIKHFDIWYSACAEFFNANASRVLCKQLGFDDVCTYSNGRLTSYQYLTPMEPYTVDFLCTGEEDSLSECQTSFTFDNFTLCDGEESEVIVSCMNHGDQEVQLTGSTIESEGFLQARCGHQDEWAYINPGYYQWNSKNHGTIACSTLGYEKFAFVDRRMVTATDLFPVVNREMYCGQADNDLFSCPFIAIDEPEDGLYAWVSCGFEASILGQDVFLCGSHHTCHGRCGSWRHGCSCDDLCTYFKDCCFDYEDLCYNKPTDVPSTFPSKVDKNRYECHDFLNVNIFVVSKCSPYWTDDFLKSSCQQDQPSTDITSHIPVYDNDGVVYRNIFCALCSDVKLTELTAFQALLVSYNWTADRNVTSAKRPFRGISFPTSILGTPRTCFKTQYICSGDNMDLCRAYYAPVALAERNPTCLECESGVVDYCSREDCQLHEVTCNGVRKAPLFDLFDYSLQEKNSHDQCDISLGQLFDPFLQSCRFMGCPEEYFYSVGQCVEGSLPYGAPQVVLNTTISASLECIRSALSMNEMEISELYLTAIPNNKTSSGPFSVTVVAESLLASFFIKITLDSMLLSPAGRYEVYYKCATATFLLTVKQTDRNATEDPCYDSIVTFDNTPDELSDMVSLFQNVFSYEYNPIINEFDRHDLSDACWKSLNVELECLDQSLIHPGEFQLAPSRTQIVVSVLHGEITLETSEFEMMRNGSIRACTEKLNSRSHLYEIFYNVCTAISLVSLMFTLITYQTFPKLRNVPGLCLMNLVAALFLANFTFLLNKEFVHMPSVCISVAAFSHFTWLASFAWMSVLSYNMARTFGTHSMQLHTTGNAKSRLLKFCIYAWGLPFVIMASCVFLHYCDCIDEFVFQYGGTSTCWIKDGFAVFITVGIPVATMLLFDLAVFLYTGISLRKSRHFTKHTRTNSALANDLFVELAVNARLFILLGITWIFGFIQEFWPIPVWQITFLISNSLQGLFIFVMFVMKKRVLNMWLNLFKNHRVDETTPTTKKADDQLKQSQIIPAIMPQL